MLISQRDSGNNAEQPHSSVNEPQYVYLVPESFDHHSRQWELNITQR